jgi:3-dehydro-4-phosphotetronate decarboxylase
MELSLAQACEQLQAAGRYMVQHELTWGNAGNLSARLAGDLYVITASGTRLGELDAGDFAECRLGVPGTYVRRPSKERPMHEAIYAERPEINAVLHASPFYTTLVACSDIELPSNWFVEAMYYLERIARVSYSNPGSAELGSGVRQQARRANILLLDNHGVLVYDTSVQEALMGMHTLEMVCRMWITSKSAGIPMRGLAPDVVEDFLKGSGYKPRREWPQ